MNEKLNTDLYLESETNDKKESDKHEHGKSTEFQNEIDKDNQAEHTDMESEDEKQIEIEETLSKANPFEEEIVNDNIPVIDSDDDLPPIRYLNEEDDIAMEYQEVGKETDTPLYDEEEEPVTDLDNQEDEKSTQSKPVELLEEYENEEKEEETEPEISVIQYIPNVPAPVLSNNLVSSRTEQTGRFQGKTRINSALTGQLKNNFHCNCINKT